MLLLFVLAVLAVVCSEPVVLAAPVNYDDLALKLCKDDTTFTIHGWWPEYTEHSWPEFCNRTTFCKFSINDVKELLPQLNKYWYACSEWNITNEQLWFHEVNKHASCIPELSLQNVMMYFAHTLEAYHLALQSQWFGCCKTNATECLLPFNKSLNETKWLQYCHR